MISNIQSKGMGMTLTIDYDFRKQIQGFNLSVNYCFQCATCTGICPVAKMTNGEFNPRKLIEASILGLKDKLIELQQPNVWYCLTCQKCVELCPQHVELTEIFDVIKNSCVKSGKIPDAFNSQAITVLETGVALPFSDAIMKRRQKLGLDDYKTADPKEIQTLLKGIGFDKLLRFETTETNEKKGEK